MKLLRLALVVLALLSAGVADVAGLKAGVVEAAPVGYIGHIGSMGPAARSIDPDAKAAFAAMTVQPDSTQQRNISNLIRCAKTSSVWTPLDMFQVYAQHTQQASLVDLRNPSRVATAVNSPTWTQYRGFAGDGATSYVNTQYNPFNGPNFTQNSASAGMYSLTDDAVAASAFGFFNGTNGITVRARSTGSNLFSGRINQEAVNNFGSTSTGIGLFVVNRTGAGNLQGYQNGTLRNSFLTSSTAVNNSVLYVGGLSPTALSTVQVAMAFAGSSLNASQQVAISQCANTYLQAVGAR